MTRTATFTPQRAATFRPLGIEPEPVTRVARKEAIAPERFFSGADGFLAVVPEQLVSRLVEFARLAAPNEWFGLVVGRVCEDDLGRYVLVLGVVPDPDAEASRASVRTTPASELRTRTSAALLYPDGVPIGWAHSHPHYTVRFSEPDRANQRTWTQPHALGIVVDPWDADQIAVYRGPGSERLERVDDDTRRGNANAVIAEAPLETATALPARESARGVVRAAALAGVAIVIVCVLAWRDNSRTRDLDHRVALLERERAELAAVVVPATRALPPPAADSCPATSLAPAQPATGPAPPSSTPAPPGLPNVSRVKPQRAHAAATTSAMPRVPSRDEVRDAGAPPSPRDGGNDAALPSMDDGGVTPHAHQALSEVE